MQSIFPRIILSAGIIMQLSIGCNSLTAASGIPLAANGKAKAVIVTPEKASPPVKFAAEELQEYLKKITGADFHVAHKIPESGPAIILGEKFGKSAGIDVNKLKRDGYTIKTVGNRIYIAGKDDDNKRAEILFSVKKPLPKKISNDQRHKEIGNTSWDFQRGTLNGVYDFLEQLGVRWFFAGPKGEMVKKSKTLSIRPINKTEEPYFDLRVNGMIAFMGPKRKGMFDEEEFKYLGWTLRNQRLWLVRNRASSKWMAFNHRPKRQQWGRRFGKNHPEYFALLSDGKRASNPKGWRIYLNYTSNGMLKETVEDMDAYFSGKKPELRGIKSIRKYFLNNGWEPNTAYGDTFSLLPNDGLRVDHSPESLKYIRENKPLPFRHNNYIWQFVDKAARKLKKRQPDKYITCLAYQSYWEVPDPDVVKKLPDNVIVGIAALSGCSRVNTFMVDKRRKDYLDLLKRWSKMSDTPMLFWTYWLYRFKQADRKGVPLLMPHGAQKFIKAHAPYGRYMFMQHDWLNFTFEILNRYIVYRLLWDPDANVDELVDDYCKMSFGPAAPVMKEMLTDIETRCEKNASTNADLVAIWERGFPAGTMKDYRNRITQAEKLTAGTRFAPNVELMDKYFLSPMEKARKNYHDKIKALRDKGKDIIKAYSCPARSIKIDGKYDHAWKCIGGRPYFNNVNGRVTKPVAKHRIRYSKKALYFLFDIPDTDAVKKLDAHRKDYLEIFLDVNNDRETYYWMQIFPDGKFVSRNFPGPGEPPLDWDSKATVKTSVNDKGWLVEVAIPLNSIKLDGKNWLKDIQIGAMLCLTKMDLVHGKKIGAFNTSNPIVRGGFHNPGIFNRMRFVDPETLRKAHEAKRKAKSKQAKKHKIRND